MFIHARMLSKTFKETVVFSNLSFTIPFASVFALTGPNGSGKSTLLKMMAGIIRPDTGFIFISERQEATDYLPPASDASAVLPGSIYLSQETQLFNELTVADNLNIFSSVKAPAGQKRKMERNPVQAHLVQKLGLRDFWHKSVSKLSGGQKQRVHLAIALAANAPIYLLDEPDAGIDVHYLTALGELLRQMAQSGRTVIFSTHNQSLLANLADAGLELGK